MAIGERRDDGERDGVNYGLAHDRMRASPLGLRARPKVDYIYLAVIIMSFPGYPLVAAFATLFGLPNVFLLSHTWLNSRCAYEIVLKKTPVILQEESHNAI